MTRQQFQQLTSQAPVLLDGEIRVGCNERECPEKWVLDHFDTITGALCSFKDAGSVIVRAPTAGANRYRLEAFGLASQTREINRELMRRCRAALESISVLGVCSTTGMNIEPFGELGFEEAVKSFSEQGESLLEGGADGFICHMTDIQEARAAVLALRELGDLPVMVYMGFGQQWLTANGTDPLSALVTLQSIGADAVGFGGTGEYSAAEVIAKIKPFAAIPLFAFPPAGAMSPEQYANSAQALIHVGVNLIGGSSDASPKHIASIRSRLHRSPCCTPVVKSISALSSARRTVMLGRSYPFAVVGERINPTGKKQLQASLREGSLDMVKRFAVEQEQRKASVLDVNMGLSGIDEMAMMLRSVNLLSCLSPLPLCIDTTRPEVVEAALRRYPGRALVNSISGEKERIERTLPATAKYGAMFIILPLTDAGIPATVKERIGVVDIVLTAASSFGYTVNDVAVDGLVMTISSDQGAALATLDLIEYCSQTLRTNTIVGLSNVSFGMPERQWINGAFLGMAMGRGLTMAISNPSSDGIMATVQAYNSLRSHDFGMLMQSGNFTGIGQ
jgi:5-methyltetrahydrofolate--homocysteine methyltransferase